MTNIYVILTKLVLVMDVIQRSLKQFEITLVIMKRYLYFLILTALVVIASYNLGFASAIDVSQQLNRMEEQLFAREYNVEPDKARLDRIETAVFGAPNSAQPTEQRLQVLSQFFQFPQQQPPQESAQKASSSSPPLPRRDESGYTGLINQTPTEESSSLPDIVPSESRYPAVLDMEERVFRQSFQQDPVERRLERLESKVFGQIQSGTLQERSDKLQSVILGNRNREEAANDPALYSSSDNSGNKIGNINDLLKALVQVEKKVLKETFPQDSVENRLSRLEMKIFNSTASELSPEERFYRIVSVVTARNSSGNEQAYQRGGPSLGTGSGSSGGTPGNGIEAWGAMLLMILMSLI